MVLKNDTEGRALRPFGRDAGVTVVFQSSLSPKGERYYRRAMYLEVRRCFNPRSPRRESATRSVNLSVPPCMFQSSLSPKGERYSVITSSTPGNPVFQSSLSPKGERYT